MQFVGCAPAVREQEQAQCYLGNEKRLAERKRMGVETAGIPLPPQVDPAPAKRKEVHDNDQHPIQLMQSKHRADTTVA